MEKQIRPLLAQSPPPEGFSEDQLVAIVTTLVTAVYLMVAALGLVKLGLGLGVMVFRSWQVTKHRRKRMEQQRLEEEAVSEA